jgi:hypothetical protein
LPWEYDPQEVAIDAKKRRGELQARGSLSHLLVAPGVSKLHKRRAIKKAGTPNAYEVEWMVAQLNGVNCFVHDDGEKVTIVLTEKDLKP